MKSLLRYAALAVLLVALPHLSGRAVKNNVGALAGKPLIIEFWATWCEPCRETIPHLNEIYKTYKDKGLEIIGITKEDEAAVQGFVKEVPINYHVGRDPESVLAAHFGITVIPHAMLVDKTGKITWEGHPLTMQPGDIESILK
jgi:thiol-disulfide isomerase/thioredoxin